MSKLFHTSATCRYLNIYVALCYSTIYNKYVADLRIKKFENKLILMGKRKETCQSMPVPLPTSNEHCLLKPVRSPTTNTMKVIKEAGTTLV